LVAGDGDVALAAPGAPVSVEGVPVCFEQAENKNAPAAKSSGRVEAVRFFMGDFFLESLILT
jgi:hypothetical protein